MKQILHVFVPGRPVPKGSLIAFCSHQGRVKPAHLVCRPRVTEDARGTHAKALRAWLGAIAGLANHFVREPYAGAVFVSCEFLFAKPRTNKDPYPTSRRCGDTEKILRSVLDAISMGASYGGRVIVDDSQAVTVHGLKRWAGEGEKEGLILAIYKMMD